MDDYKRTLYMIALRELQELQRAGTPDRAWLCVKLATVLRSENQKPDFDFVASIDDLVTEFFPDFLELFDGSRWGPDNFSIQDPPAVAAAWWPKDWLEPRIRALECLLRD